MPAPDHGPPPDWWPLFNGGPWCPLFGPLPVPPEAYPATVAGRALAVIESARELLEVYPDDYRRLLDPEPLTAADCWPDPQACPLDAAFVQACRLLVGPGYGHVLQYAQGYDARCTFAPDGELTLAPDQVRPELLLHFARRALSVGPQSEAVKAAGRKLTDAECLAVLAIRGAWWTLDYALCPEAHQTEAGAFRRCQQAEGLLRLAQAEAVRPDAELGAHRRESLSKFARVRAEELHDERAHEWQCWQAEADRIRKAHRRPLSVSELAAKVKETLNLSESVRTIRLRIKP